MNRRRVAGWVRAVTPPVLLPHVQRLALGRRPPSPPEWEYVPEGWRRAPHLRGWNEPSVADAYRTKLDAYRAACAGTGPLAFASTPALDVGEPNVPDQNVVLAFTHAVLRAAWGKERISVLDWGGGVAYYSFVARAVLPSTVAVEYHCADLPAICAVGRELVPGVTFWDDDRCFDRRYDVVLASSSLQYAEDWQSTLRRLAAATTDALFLTRVPAVVEHESFVVLQRTQGYRFDTEYLSWVFNRGEVLQVAADAGLELVREFVLGFRPHVVGAPEQDETWAALLRRGGGPEDA